jgi:hypothetical protein
MTRHVYPVYSGSLSWTTTWLTSGLRPWRLAANHPQDGDAGAQDGEAGTTSTNGSASAGASLCPLTSVTSLTSHSWLISERLVRGMPNVRTLEVSFESELD